jgi:hypothetical protein
MGGGLDFFSAKPITISLIFAHLDIIFMTINMMRIIIAIISALARVHGAQKHHHATTRADGRRSGHSVVAKEGPMCDNL